MSPTFANPIKWEDLPDPEVFRVGHTYYMSASSFHFSPGAPLLKSDDLINWEYAGHSVPELPPSSRFSLDGVRPTAYGKGVWASTLRYRNSDGLFYFYSPIQGTDKTYVYTAKSPGDVWTAHPPIERFYYDLGLLIDDDDTMYIAHGTKTIQVAQLSPDGLTEVASKVVHISEDYIEGARMYKIQGTYYIWVTKPGDTQRMLKSTAGPFGPFEARDIIAEMRSPLAGAGPPHQGGLVDTPNGQWYYISFTDAYPAGRVPLLAPVFFNKGRWLLQYPTPLALGDQRSNSNMCFRKHEFSSQSTLEHCWEWNHNPDKSKWSIQKGQLVLKTGTVTQSLHLATNTLTHRTIGPGSIVTFCMDTSKIRDGDRAGISMFRDESAYIGIHHDGENAKLVYVDGIKTAPINAPVGFLNGRPVALDWKCISLGTMRAEMPLRGDQVWLRIKVDLRPTGFLESGRRLNSATFEYSYDGVKFIQLGPTYQLSTSTAGYVGYRFGLFNFATLALGGEIRVRSCDFQMWDPTL
ncbi:glycosyl hydrolase [Aspergillus heterothallicus]